MNNELIKCNLIKDIQMLFFYLQLPIIYMIYKCNIVLKKKKKYVVDMIVLFSGYNYIYI